MPAPDLPTQSPHEFLDPSLRRRVSASRRAPGAPGAVAAGVLECPMEPLAAMSVATPAIGVKRGGRIFEAPIIPKAPTAQVIVEAVIFDVDGVIADTAGRHADAWHQLAVEEDLDFDADIADALRGLSRPASLRMLLGDREVPAERFAAMMERKNHLFVASLDCLSPADILPGVVSLMDSLAERDIKIAAASASKNARTVLDRIGLAERFDAIVDGNEVGRPKPAPDLFLRAAARLRIRPDRCVVIEDAAAGIAAARNAGMRSIGLGDSDRLSAATAVLPSLTEMDAGTLIELISSNS